MRRATIAFILSASLFGAAKQRDWKTAVLNETAYTTENVGARAMVTGTPAWVPYAPNNASGMVMNVRVTWEAFELDTGDLVYRVACPVKLNHAPNVTIHKGVKYAADSDGFHLMDDDGREFRMTVLSKTASPSKAVSSIPTPTVKPSTGAPTAAVTDADVSQGSINCRGWMKISESLHLGFAMGLKDGYGVAAGEGKLAEGSLLGLRSATYGEIEDGIAEFCAKPENASLRAVYGAMVLSMKLDGATPESIEHFEARIRKLELTPGK